MTETKLYDLEERTLIFAKNCRKFIAYLPKNTATIEDGKQLIRASGSTGANYIEANEALSKKDFQHRIKICRKEAKEARYWLQLIETGNNNEAEKEKRRLIQEAQELMNIFGAILKKL